MSKKTFIELRDERDALDKRIEALQEERRVLQHKVVFTYQAEKAAKEIAEREARAAKRAANKARRAS